MKIALASARIVDRDISYNLSQMERYMKEAKTMGADLVCFGEAFLQGFNALFWQYEKDKEIALTTSSQTFAHIQSLTKEIGIDVLFGYNELSENAIYSSCALVANGKILHNYRRISIGDWHRTEHTMQEHRAIYEAIMSGNAELACELTTKHIENAKEHMLGGINHG